ncbi:MAG: DUF2273 domain-containing protein [Clostridiales bacterium]|jgi:uncharacterized membrane protein|nr:DUF2273 domain-containing protein [Clostridiales bacterium]MDR2713363.1 DUF2273 domain-containing protein [Clostridiales bacterium]
MDIAKWLNYLWENHRGKVIGGLLGLCFGLFVLKYGFWQTFFVLICVVAGYIIGSRTDAGEIVKGAITRIFKKEDGK